MARKLQRWAGEHPAVMFILGVALVITAVSIVAAVALLRPGEDEKPPQGVEGRTNPAFVGTSGLAEVATVSDGGTSAAGAGGIFLVSLSEGQAAPQETETLPVTTGEPLSETETEQILARLPQLTVEPEDQVDFHLSEDVVPPPRPGETIEEPFPPPAPEVRPEQVETGPLEVLRYAPEGEIPLAPFLSVTFNQPMVPLTTLGALSAAEIPVRLEPDLPGTWRWLGTKTLTFEYDSDAIDRLPKATEYVVTVPAGTESATGGALTETVSWSFRTPPVQMVTYYPSNSPQPLEPVFVVGFDQRIDDQAVLNTIQVRADARPVSVRLASEDELAADKEASRTANQFAEGRWLAFVAREPLPPDTGILVTVGPGTPSAEGSLVTQEAQRFEFRTYAPLRIERYGCAWYGDACPPLAPFFIDFNNPIDGEAYEETMLEVEPALPNATVGVMGDTITIRGTSAGRTMYRVTLSGTLRDTFGQTLGEDAELTFQVGSAEPFLSGPQEPLVTLDPAAKVPALTVYTVNYNRLKVRAYRVEPSDWPAYKRYLQDFYSAKELPVPPGQRVIDKSVGVEAVADALVEVNIDLSAALEGDTGQLVVVIEPEDPRPDRDRLRQQMVHTWVQVTQIGLDAFADRSEMVAWASALQDGAPLAGVTIDANPGRTVATTGADGTVRFALPQPRTMLLVARLGEDVAILPRSAYPWSEDGWELRPVQDELRWYVFDDRAMYRPGEEVHVKGWIRRVGGAQDGDVGLPQGLTAVRYEVIGPQGNELLNGRADANPLGGFDFAFTLPTNANLGYAEIRLYAEGEPGNVFGGDYYHSLQIQEFRRPEFEVSARNETTGPYFAGEHAVVAVEAKYYAGGPLPNAEVTWQVRHSSTNYSPPNWPDFVFGKWEPWWWHSYGPVYAEGGYYISYEPGIEGEEVETFSGATDASGNHYLQLAFDRADQVRPESVRAEAMVMDVNRQAWASATSLLVHPAELYVGLRSERTFVEQGDPLKIDLIVTDLDGNPVPDRRIEVRAERMEWKFRQGDWREEAVDVQECVQGSGPEPVSCVFETPAGGKYEITAFVTDDAGRRNQSEFTRWVSGGQQPPARKVELESVILIPDKETYQPGDIAQILVQAPFSPAEGLLRVTRSGFLYIERFQVQADTVTLQVPIEEAHIPNLQVQVDLVGAAPRTDARGEVIETVPPRPAYATGQLELSIPPLQRTLELAVTPRETELEPGGETMIDVLLTDAAGQPVANAELAVVVVDEAVLALTNYSLADPVATFYSLRGGDVDSTYGRASIVLASPESLEVEASLGDAPEAQVMATSVVEEVVVEREVAMPVEAPAASEKAADEGVASEPIRLRTDFDPLAAFVPEVRTGADGRAAVPVPLPDNLTRYRVMVVAVAGDKQFGSGEANLTARLPLMVRPSAPRFLNFGDRFELPVVLQNQTDEPLAVDVAVRAGNLELLDSPGLRVTVPARDRVEVRFPATTVMAGTARLQIAAVSGAIADAATVELPVYTPTTTEAFATYGVIDEGAVAQPVEAPEGVFPQFGGLEISTSSTALQALTDAVLYLVAYPFECSEQLASRLMAVAALRDVLTAFTAPGLPSPDEMQASVRRDIERLSGLQNDDGGFPYWIRGDDSIPFNTIHVAHALQRANIKGFEVPEELHARVLNYLQFIEDHYPSWYDKRTRQTLSAYALYVRDLMGDRDPPKARQLLNEAGLEQLSLEAVGWLWQVLIDDPGSAAELEAIRRHVTNSAVETAGAANFTTSYGDQAYLLLHSDRRTDAIILDALIADNPDSDLIPKVVNGLLAHRTAGRWGNTQENVFVLLALDRYFSTFEAQTPDFVANIWLGDTYVGGHAYVGRTTERHATTIPMAYLLDSLAATGPEDTQDLILGKEGPGRLYYRLGLRYAPTDLQMDAVDMGFVVERTYDAVDDPEDVVQDEDGVWHIKAGALVRVRLKMVADNRRYHVALVDPLPAGLEIVNAALAVSGSVPQDPSALGYRYGWWWWGTWYEHQNMRDERAEAFASLLWDGVYDYSYVARATTPGTFVVPPPKAEEMYSPEVFGRGSGDVVIVE